MRNIIERLECRPWTRLLAALVIALGVVQVGQAAIEVRSDNVVEICERQSELESGSMELSKR